MRLVVLALATLLPVTAVADLFPHVTMGPVITGVGTDEAHVAWYTAHHQGAPSSLNACRRDALTGTPNDTIPTLTLTPANAQGRTSFPDPECSRFHRVRLTGLSPDTTYNLTLDKPRPDGTPVAGHLRTAPPAGSRARVRFLVYGDNRDEPVGSPSTRADHQALVDAVLARETGADFLVHTGDFALNLPLVSGPERGYQAFFEIQNPLLRGLPIFPAFGNHESIAPEFFNRLFSARALAGLPHPNYGSWGWGPVHLVALDAFQGDPDLLKGGARKPKLDDRQAAWLAADLEAARAAGKAIFLVAHQGPFSHGADDKAHGGSPDVAAKVVPLMVESGALGIFAGHDHYYQRGRSGCVDWLVVGAGGAPMIDPDPAAPGVLAAKKAVSYLVVTVEGGVARAVAKDVRGAVFDEFVFQPAGCRPADPDAGVPDADAGAEDGAEELGDAGTGDAGEADGAGSSPDAADETGGAEVSGCACSSGPGAAALAALLGGAMALLGFVRRRP